MIWVSHDQGEVCRNCPQVCLLEDGRSSPVRTTAELAANPGTVSAARLMGCRNCVPVRPGPGPELVEVPAWGLTLRAAAPWREGVTALGVHAGRVHPAEAEEANAFPCRVVRVVEEGALLLAALCPEGAAPGAPSLWMELPRGAWKALPDRTRLRAAVWPEDLMLLE